MLFAQVDVINAMPWYAWVAIVAIIGGTVTGVVNGLIHHRERMAMLNQGINPDAPAEPKARIGEL